MPERAIMRLRDLGDDESWVAGPNAAAGDTQGGHVPNPRLTRVFISGQPETWNDCEALAPILRLRHALCTANGAPKADRGSG